VSSIFFNVAAAADEEILMPSILNEETMDRRISFLKGFEVFCIFFWLCFTHQYTHFSVVLKYKLKENL